MKILPKTFVRLAAPAAVALALLLSSAERANADIVTYTFEQFTAPPIGGSPAPTTPLLNIAPESGPSSFQANFLSSPNFNAFFVFNFQPTFSFSGNGLFEFPDNGFGVSGNALTITLNQAVSSVSLVFGTELAGTLQFTSPSGNTSVTSTHQGGPDPNFDLGGNLAFSSSTPFSTFSLTTGPGGTLFGIDNLTVDTVPETSSLILSAIGLVFVVGYHWLRRRRIAA